MKKCALSGNALKWIAAVLMTVDHAGVILFPEVRLLRVLGRLSFPIFAFMIAEGSRYTRQKLRYFLGILGLGVACQAVLFFYNGSRQLNVLLTFSLSLALIFSFSFFKEQLFAAPAMPHHPFFAAVLFSLVLAGVVLLGSVADLDYGVVGCMLPLFAALLHPPKNSANTALHRADRPVVHVLTMSVGLLLLALENGGIQYFSLLAVPLLLLYSGKRGKRRMKYFFYIFYPAHLVLLWIASRLLF